MQKFFENLRNCVDSKLVERVDNYALLNMDIIWCYLNLQNLQELKNAGKSNYHQHISLTLSNVSLYLTEEERLKLCEKSLEKCYGSDLSRLAAIKSESTNKHVPIYVRLNLLKVAIFFN